MPGKSARLCCSGCHCRGAEEMENKTFRVEPENSSPNSTTTQSFFSSFKVFTFAMSAPNPQFLSRVRPQQNIESSDLHLHSATRFLVTLCYPGAIGITSENPTQKTHKTPSRGTVPSETYCAY